MKVTEQVIRKLRMMSPSQLRKLLTYIRQCEREEEEDRRDVELARKALAEADEKGWIPWEQVKAELGFKSPSNGRKVNRSANARRH